MRTETTQVMVTACVQLIYILYIAIQFLFKQSEYHTMYDMIMLKLDIFIDIIYTRRLTKLTRKLHKHKLSDDAIKKFNDVYSQKFTVKILAMLIQSMFINWRNSTTFDGMFQLLKFGFLALEVFTIREERFRLILYSVQIASIFILVLNLTDMDVACAAIACLGYSMLPLFLSIFWKSFKKYQNIKKTKHQLKTIGTTLMTAFSNSLPSKIIPKIMHNESLSCDIAKDVNICYIFLADSEMYGNQLDYLSKVNHFYSALDFFVDILDIQKIKSSYSYYICCTGA